MNNYHQLLSALSFFCFLPKVIYNVVITCYCIFFFNIQILETYNIGVQIKQENGKTKLCLYIHKKYIL